MAMVLPTVHDFLSLASQLARRAGEMSLAHVHDFSTSRKSDHTIVTSVDHAIQADILRGIGESFPDHPILAEECVEVTGDAQTRATAARYCWVVDPLDGTRNYVSGLPCFATSIAVLDQGRPIAAAVYEHNQRMMFTAGAGGGAFLDGKPIRVDDPPKHRDHLLGIPSSKDSLTQLVIRDWLATRGFICRNLGATTVHLALVAAGSLAGAFAKQAKLWDIAAGLLLMNEAGGRMTDPFGKDLLPFRLDADPQRDIPFLAAGPTMHRRLLETIQSVTI